MSFFSDLTDESGQKLTTETGTRILVENSGFTPPFGTPDLRLTIMVPDASSVLQLDASNDLQGNWSIKYEKTPGGCGAASIALGLRYEEVFAKGYWTAMNIVEISTGDDVLQVACLTGATKLYVQSTAPYDASQGEETQQVYLWDGSTLTMRIPVTGVGQDATGPYITIGTPLAGGGNPTTLPAYSAGTVLGRRRYAGHIRRRTRPKQSEPSATIALGSLAQIFDSTIGSYTIDVTVNADVGTALYTVLSAFALRWPHLTISAGNFPVVGSTFSGTRNDSTVTSMVADMLSAIPTGDVWSLIVGHDRTPRLVRLYTSATNSYAFPREMDQGSVDFEPLTIQVQDQDATTIFNAIKVTGAQNPTTQQPYNAIVTDPSSITIYKLQLDGSPVSNGSLTSDAACASFGQGLLKQRSLAQQQASFRVFTRNDYTPTFQPQGLTQGDAVRGTDGITVTNFDQISVSRNNCPDSEVFVPAIWTNNNFTYSATGGPGGSGAWTLTANGSAIVSGPAFYAAPGRTFVPAAYLDASHVTGGTFQAQFCTNSGAVIYTLTQTNGVAGVVTGTAITLGAGVTQVAVRFVATAVTLSGGIAVGAHPMLTEGSTAVAYVPNYAAPVIFGLASSVVSTLTASGDRFQDVTFAPIEPDWNSAMAESQNALAGQIRGNGPPGTSLDQYCVAGTMFPLSYSSGSLVVTVPASLAIFARGTTPVVVGGNTFTVAASAVSWVWLNPNNTWTVNTNPTTVAGAILLGFFQASTGVMGFTRKCSIGVVTLSQSQLPSMGSQAAPVVSGVSGITYPVVGNGTYDAQVTFTVDVATAPWLVGLAMFAVKAGFAGEVRTYPKGQIDVAQSSAGTYTPIWKSIGAGNAEDLYVAYLDGQGRLSGTTKVTTTVANPAGTTAMGGIGTTAPNPSSGASAFTYYANGGGTYDAECTINLDANGTSSNNNLAELEVVIAPHSRALASNSTGWAPSGNPIAVNNTGIYVVTAGGCGVQVQFDVGVRFIGHDGKRSYVYIIGTTTASQLAQLPFVGTTVDPATGYIVISDQAIYPTSQQYALTYNGVGSLLSASWNQKAGSSSVSPTIWLFYTTAGGGNGYIAYWGPGGNVYIYKVTAGVYTLEATSATTVAHDATNFHNLEFIATSNVSGTVNLAATLDGNLMVQYIDSSSPYAAGAIAAQFRDATATNYIDEKTIQIDLGGSPSSAGFKSQGSIVTTYVPGGQLQFTNLSNQIGIYMATGNVSFPDGTSYSQTGLGSYFGIYSYYVISTCPVGTYYFLVWLNVVTQTYGWYISQTPPTQAQVMASVTDGNVQIGSGTATVGSGGNTVVVLSGGKASGPTGRQLL